MREGADLREGIMLPRKAANPQRFHWVGLPRSLGALYYWT